MPDSPSADSGVSTVSRQHGLGTWSGGDLRDILGPFGGESPIGGEPVSARRNDLAPKKWTLRYAAVTADSRPKSAGERYPSDECSRCR
jgi:hypothetical protein